MKGAIETMMGVVIIALSTVLITGFIIASLNTQKAQNYHAAVVAEVEASDFSPTVIASCEEKAIENGYTDLQIEQMTSVKEEKYAKVTLMYDYPMPLLNVLLEHKIVGYAR
ncbi:MULTISPECIES: hypothetical protein [Clostridia]|jgi:hypothetical protein|uniref:hypothetical protein n=1 Tax=Clostridia TaxID=186801 RepID=UPI0007408742|nr:hypothetical protein [Clostridium sp. C105KSO13]CUX28377.1 hypothetical protein BN3456_01079 [Clostridium sp. C105KSO13]HAX51789.1 hypothetical protein [Lachnospiraceae bacterium]